MIMKNAKTDEQNVAETKPDKGGPKGGDGEDDKGNNNGGPGTPTTP
jgi:hypothetical protein